MILSDRTIREEIANGRIVIEPFDDACVQPSSVDLHIDRFFRVFRNHTMGHIDVKQNLEDLTELVEIGPDDAFMLHPGSSCSDPPPSVWPYRPISSPDSRASRPSVDSDCSSIPRPGSWTPAGTDS